MDLKRVRLRTPVDIAVTLTTVLQTTEARVIDLSEDGAQISGATFAEGTKFQIGYNDQTVYAQCRWSEVDRMGVLFPFGLHDGPLHERLIQARALKGRGASAIHAPGYGNGAGETPSFSSIRAAGRSGFGRRALA